MNYQLILLDKTTHLSDEPKKSTFWSCIFERVVIPEGVTVIEEGAFNSSYYLKEITDRKSVV